MFAVRRWTETSGRGGGAILVEVVRGRTLIFSDSVPSSARSAAIGSASVSAMSSSYSSCDSVPAAPTTIVLFERPWTGERDSLMTEKWERTPGVACGWHEEVVQPLRDRRRCHAGIMAVRKFRVVKEHSKRVALRGSAGYKRTPHLGCEPPHDAAGRTHRSAPLRRLWLGSTSSSRATISSGTTRGEPSSRSAIV